MEALVAPQRVEYRIAADDSAKLHEPAEAVVADQDPHERLAVAENGVAERSLNSVELITAGLVELLA